MNYLDGLLLDVLRAATKTPELALDGAPRRLTGGFWAELLAFRLLDAPDGWTGDLVARLMPDPGIAAKESAIQAEVAAQGFPTPAVHLAGGPDDGLGRSFMVMDLADGAPMLDGLDGARAFASLPTLARRLPSALGEAMAALHRLDVAPLRARLAALDGTGPAVDLRDFVARLHASAGSLDRPDLATAARWLEANPPPPEPEVICHGDLHPFNLLVDAEDTVTVLDWSAALLDRAAQADAIDCHRSQATDNPVLRRRLELMTDQEMAAPLALSSPTSAEHVTPTLELLLIDLTPREALGEHLLGTTRPVVASTTNERRDAPDHQRPEPEHHGDHQQPRAPGPVTPPPHHPRPLPSTASA